MSAPPINTKITLNFSWTGPNSNELIHQRTVKVTAIGVIFKNFDISFPIPDNIEPSTITTLSRRVQVLDVRVKREGVSSSMYVAIEQMDNFRVEASVYIDNGDKWSLFRRIPLNRPKELKIGQTYNLKITSAAADGGDVSLSASLLEEKVEPQISDSKSVQAAVGQSAQASS